MALWASIVDEIVRAFLICVIASRSFEAVCVTLGSVKGIVCACGARNRDTSLAIVAKRARVLVADAPLVLMVVEGSLLRADRALVTSTASIRCHHSLRSVLTLAVVSQLTIRASSGLSIGRIHALTTRGWFGHACGGANVSTWADFAVACASSGGIQHIKLAVGTSWTKHADLGAVVAGQSLATHIGLSAGASLTLLTGHLDLTIGAKRANLALAGGFSA